MTEYEYATAYNTPYGVLLDIWKHEGLNEGRCTVAEVYAKIADDPEGRYIVVLRRPKQTGWQIVEPE